MKRPDVVMIGPSRFTRGGITSVLESFEKMPFWEKFKCFWIESYIDGNWLYKIFYFIRGYAKYLRWIFWLKAIHVHLSEPISALRKGLFILPAIVLGKKVVIHFHSFSPQTTIDSKWRLLYKFLFSKADCIIVLSEIWRARVVTSLGDLPVEVVLNPCAKNVLSAKKNQSGPKYILFAGTLNSRKGFADLIKAFSSLSDAFPEWTLIMAGNGDLDKAKRQIRDLEIEGRVELKGWVRGQEKDALFQNASIFCLPSYAEGLPMAVLDAISFGIPIVTCPVGGIPDIISDGESGLLVNCGDIGGLAAALKSVMESLDLRDRLTQGARAIAEGRLSVESISKRMSDVYIEYLKI